MVTLPTSASVRVVDLRKAYNTVDACMETTQERITAIVATKLAEVDAAPLAPEKRGRLLTDLRKWVDADTQKYGVETSDLCFTAFLVNPPFRFLDDNAAVSPS